MIITSDLSPRDKRTVDLGFILFLCLIRDIFGKRTAIAISCNPSNRYALGDLIADLSVMRQSLLHSRHVPMSELTALGKMMYSHFRRRHEAVILSQDPEEFKKLNLVYSFLRKLKVSVKTDAIEDFKHRMLNHQPSNVDEFYMSSVADELYYLLHDFEDGVPILPRHGPGSVAEGTRSLLIKERLMRIPQCINYLNLQDGTDCYQHYPRGEVKKHAVVTAVPKDSKSERIICKEPVVLQFFQQGLARALRTVVKNSPWRSQYCFDDQVPNQQDARQGSVDNSLATLDLKQASDSVDLNTIVQALRRLPRLRRWVLLTRSTHFIFPDGEVVRSKILSPMGSGICFDIESLFFLAIARAAVHRTLGRRVRDVRVFGDDIIVPSEAAEAVINDLEIFGFTVNKEKSFITGKFRESCGKEWYAGHDVTPLYFRVVDPQDAQPKHWSAFRSLYNSLKLRGHALAATILLENCEAHFPKASFIWDDDEENTWFSFSGYTGPREWDPDYQASFVSYVLPQVVTKHTDELDQYHLMQWLITAHLRREGVVIDGAVHPGVATAKCRVGKCRYYINKIVNRGIGL
ncbi:RNA-directed RNA polymerase [ssRNA phage SRR5466725_7]|uniref:RNA-directed RNA polymerase n=1 Tax=ssRNA phage SRR5466725_7 TaxID=2786426 RepID=A0A8S5L5B4_9VIRU|nr:RNA-directed RNA polymerase [ssRNA phage SRR5466725_7]DAD52418.1 TPA_asm: RNA-directed RNA polymerase [ssRNA phage SRR5466725_7]